MSESSSEAVDPDRVPRLGAHYHRALQSRQGFLERVGKDPGVEVRRQPQGGGVTKTKILRALSTVEWT